MLTDKYPNIPAFQRLCSLSNNSVDFISTSVDATDVPTNLTGFRTFFTSFHHFQPEAARKILQDAVNKNAAIGIFEFTERTFLNALKVLLLGHLLVLLQTPFIRSFKLSRLFWTYIIPISPLIYFWDALVSHLRTYTVQELNELSEKINTNNYHWETGKFRSPKSNFNITYLVGFPTKN